MTTVSARQVKTDKIVTRFRKRRGSAYWVGILESLLDKDLNGDVKPEDTIQIEEIMRDRFSTLDNLTFNEFKKEAKVAWLAVKQLRKEGIFETPEYKD